MHKSPCMDKKNPFDVLVDTFHLFTLLAIYIHFAEIIYFQTAVKKLYCTMKNIYIL